MPVSYDAHSMKKASHPCDQCKKFVTMEHFLNWQSKWISSEQGEPDEPLLCPDCGGAY